MAPMSRSLIAVAAALLALPAAADAATPRPKALLEAHRHNSGGRDWHVQVEINRTSTALATVVVYSQRCGETGFTKKVPIAADGSFVLTNEPFANKRGTYSVQGSFTDENRASGSWSVATADCEDGDSFRLQDATGHFLIGNPYEYAPARINGSSLAARRLRKLKYETRQNARKFDTIAKAREQGYELSTATGCPGLHHARKHGTAMWGKVLDPTAPQSLVYWCDGQNRWTLAAFMFRADGRTRPSTYSGMLQWHKHGPASGTWMSHVWLVPNAIQAFATCAPFPAFASSGAFTYEPFLIDAQADSPCSDSAPKQELDAQESADQPA